MVLRRGDLGFRWQRMLKQALPSRWIVAAAIVVDSRPTQYGFDPSADAGGCFGLIAPQRLYDLEHQRRVDCCHREITKDRINISRQRRGPLLSVGGVRPFLLVVPNEAFGALPERHCLGVGSL